MLPVNRTEQAETDLAEILDYLDERSPAAAERLATAVDERCELLGQFPDMGRAREELAPGLRSIAVERYAVFYRVTATAVEVLRILHGSRDIEGIMKADAPHPE
jgi:toxin ParE1/3/4